MIIASGEKIKTNLKWCTSPSWLSILSLLTQDTTRVFYWVCYEGQLWPPYHVGIKKMARNAFKKPKVLFGITDKLLMEQRDTLLTANIYGSRMNFDWDQYHHPFRQRQVESNLVALSIDETNFVCFHFKSDKKHFSTFFKVHFSC